MWLGCVVCGELPIGLGVMFVSMVSPSGDFFFQGLLVRDAAAEGSRDIPIF
jgi:hypothetical protein